MTCFTCEKCGSWKDDKLQELFDAIHIMFFIALDGRVKYSYLDTVDIADKHPIIKEVLLLGEEE